jgi:hypothetical protein
VILDIEAFGYRTLGLRTTDSGVQRLPPALRSHRDHDPAAEGRLPLSRSGFPLAYEVSGLRHPFLRSARTIADQHIVSAQPEVKAPRESIDPRLGLPQRKCEPDIGRADLCS